MSVEMVVMLGILALASLLWVLLCSVYPWSLNPVWIAAVVMFLDVLAIVVGTFGEFNAPGVASVAAIVLLVALPVVLKSPRQLVSALREPGVLLWIALLLLGALSLEWSPNAEYGAKKLLVAVVMGLFPGLGMYVTYRYRRRISWNGLLLVGVIYAVFVLLHGEVSAGRLTADDGNPIWIGRSALLLATVALWDAGAWLPLRIASAGLGLWVGVAAQSRGPLLSFVLAPLLVGILSIARRRDLRYRRTSLALAGIAAAVLLAMVVVLSEMPASVLDRGGRIATLVHPSALDEDVNIAGRISLQRQALERFFEQPVIGAGIGSSAPFGERLYPHSLPLELASELGAIGILLWAAAIARAFSSSRDNRLVQLLLTQVILYSLTSGDLGSNNLILVLSVFAYAARKRQPAKDAIAGLSQDRQPRGYPPAQVVPL